MAGKKSAGRKKSGSANAAAKTKTVTAEKPDINIVTDSEKTTLEKASDKTAAPKKTGAEKTKPESKQKSDKSDSKTKRKKPNPVVKYFKDLKSEFKKVVWPSKKTVLNNTGAVLASMIVSGLAIWGIDSGFAALLRELYKIAG